MERQYSSDMDAGETLPQSATLKADLTNPYMKVRQERDVTGIDTSTTQKYDRHMHDTSFGRSPPPFTKLITSLRSHQAVTKKCSDSKVCNETGECLPSTLGDEINDRSNQKRSVSFTPIVMAIEAINNGNHEELERIIEGSQLDLTELVGDGASLLHFAAAEGHIDCARILLSNGADINLADVSGWPPVHRAFLNAQLPMVVFIFVDLMFLELLQP